VTHDVSIGPERGVVTKRFRSWARHEPAREWAALRLLDGRRVRLVDFEDSGPSDRAFELAVLVEHLSAWPDGRLDADTFAALFDLSPRPASALAPPRALC
jgi:hypothetical protein